MIKGITASVFASVLFGGIYYLSPFLAPLDGEQIFGWRVLVTLPFTSALLLWRGEGARLGQMWRDVQRAPHHALYLLLSAAMASSSVVAPAGTPHPAAIIPVTSRGRTARKLI